MSITNNGYQIPSLGSDPWDAPINTLMTEITNVLPTNGTRLTTVDEHYHDTLASGSGTTVLYLNGTNVVLPDIAINSVLGTDANHNIIATTSGGGVTGVTLNTLPASLGPAQTQWYDSPFSTLVSGTTVIGGQCSVTSGTIDFRVGAGSGDYSKVLCENDSGGVQTYFKAGGASGAASVTLLSSSVKSITLQVSASSTSGYTASIGESSNGTITLAAGSTGSPYYTTLFLDATTQGNITANAAGSVEFIALQGGTTLLQLSGGTAELEGNIGASIIGGQGVNLTAGTDVSATLYTGATGGINIVAGTQDNLRMTAQIGTVINTNTEIFLNAANTGTIMLYGAGGISLQAGTNYITLVGLTTSSAGLTTGMIWRNGNVINIK